LTLNFDHIGIVVRSIDSGAQHLSDLLGPLAWTQRFDDPVLGVSVVFARDDQGIVYECIAPLGNESPVTRTLNTKTNLLNQIAYRVESLTDAVPHMRQARAAPVGPAKPAVAFGGRPVQFFLSPMGFLVELIEISKVCHNFQYKSPGLVNQEKP
jgi:methylmalonyl-CoA/ethylmalonyl-CoA epimerase